MLWVIATAFHSLLDRVDRLNSHTMHSVCSRGVRCVGIHRTMRITGDKIPAQHLHNIPAGAGAVDILPVPPPTQLSVPVLY